MISDFAPGDILVRDAPSARAGEFILVDAVTFRTFPGSYGSLREAVRAARELRAGCTIWRETFDARGRTLGRPMRLQGPDEP